MNEEKKFFYEDTYYSTMEEFIQGVVEFNERLIDEKSAEILLDQLTSCIQINLEINRPEMTNAELRHKFDLIFIYALKELFNV